MLFDSSVWIDYLRGKVNPLTDLLDKSLNIRGNIPVSLCPPIFQEILQGMASDNEHELMKDLLLPLKFLNLDSYFVAEEGARLFRYLRKKGVTIRKPNDCLIAFYAIHFKTELVHNDRDFDKIAKHTSLKIYST